MTVAGLCGIFAQAVIMRILVACFRETQIIIFGKPGLKQISLLPCLPSHDVHLLALDSIDSELSATDNVIYL